jgi:hypothetical protein
MSHLIDSALIQAYTDGAFGLAWASENRDYEPTAGTAWAEIYMLPNQPSVASLGDDGLDIHDGVMQINLNYPAGQGAGGANQKATAIRNYFYAGRSFAYSGQSVEIVSCGRGPGRVIDSWYRVPVTLFYRAWTSR